MKTKTRLISALCGLGLFFLLFACSKNNSVNSSVSIPNGKSQVSVYMMDDPIQFTKVMIDIRQVAILVDTATSQSAADNNNQWDDGYCGRGRGINNRSVVWDTLSITPGVYDLLQLRNGADTLLSSGVFTSGKILKIRVTLGPDDSVYTDSTTSYRLAVFGPVNFFDINVRRENVSSVTNNQFSMWLDFNLARSVVFWNGGFLLKPYFTVFNDVVSAKLKGQVLPFGASPLVTLVGATDTLYALPGWDGRYMVRGVPAGVYSITFTGHHGYQDTTINNITVDSMKTVQVPVVTLHQ